MSKNSFVARAVAFLPSSPDFEPFVELPSSSSSSPLVELLEPLEELPSSVMIARTDREKRIRAPIPPLNQTRLSIFATYRHLPSSRLQLEFVV